MGKQWKQCQTLFLGAPKSLQMVTAAIEIKRHLLLGRKVMTNLDSIFKSRDITLPTKVWLSNQSYGFSSGHVWMWELDYKESWTLKNWCFWTVVLEKTLESPLDSKRSNQSILKETHPEYSLEGLMLNHQYFGHLMWRANSLEKTDAGKVEGKRRRGGRGWDIWIASLTQWTWIWPNSGR